MKSLLKHLSPFAPDQSGAVSALFDFGGLIVICDAPASKGFASASINCGHVNPNQPAYASSMLRRGKPRKETKMKLKINWKELGKQLWDAVRCAAESEAFGGKPREARTSKAKWLQGAAPVLLGALGGGLVAVTGSGCSALTPSAKTQTMSLYAIGIPGVAVVTQSSAILGRDDKLVAKLQSAMDSSGLKFSAIIGTPVPAIIATDFKALKRMAEKRTGLPAITVPTTGTRHYDQGASDAWMELFKTFATKRLEVDPETVGVLGASPLDSDSTRRRPVYPDADCLFQAELQGR